MAKNRQPQPQEQEEEEEEEDYSVEEEEQHPLPKTHKHSHSHSDPEEDDPVSNIKPTTAKRRTEKESESEGKEPTAKKLKRMAKAEVEMPSSSSAAAAKKHFFQRFWSEEDEIVILNGMADYSVKKNADPVANITDFLDFIKKSLHVVDVTGLQLKDKIKKLKKKYRNNVTKRGTPFSKSHEQRVYELSKEIWGDENDGDDGVAENVTETPRVNRSASDGGATVGCRLDYSGLHEWIMNVGATKVEAKKRLEMEGKWRKFKQQEVELFLNNLELMCEQTRFVLEGLKKGC